MRSIALTFAFFITSIPLIAQNVFSNKTNEVLEKVIKDYPNRFHNIKGDVIVENPQTTEYKSTVQLPGSSNCIVTRYNATHNDVYSWSCTVFESEDFNLAKNKFREVYGQVVNMIIKGESGKPFILSGQYETPTEQKKFTTVIFELLPGVGPMKNLKVDLSLQYELTGWKVLLSVYNRDRNDEERGVVNGN